MAILVRQRRPGRSAGTSPARRRSSFRCKFCGIYVVVVVSDLGRNRIRCLIHELRYLDDNFGNVFRRAIFSTGPPTIMDRRVNTSAGLVKD